MFSGETQVKTVIDGAAGYGIALLLVMAVAKLALLSVGFKSGFLGGPTFPLIFASTSASRWRSTSPSRACRWRSSSPASWPAPSTRCSGPR